MEPIQVFFTSKYIDGAQTRISTTPGDTHAGATVADSTHHFTAAGEQINAIITSGQHFIDTAHTMATNVSLMNAIHAEATTTIAQAQAMGCTHHKCLPPTHPQAATARLLQH
ncbi:hypothetical protein [Corynebacterium argentoratense]|uniref:hypothetical protein n=1 Tax=Corynebacterium argentoratense TaxID=42817 RepID=UPI001F466EBE|nr:hypothetical protein [Corynebacterium argentoratense]MCF1765328.1 hypothetical protein [Corynebacterium argentoratense]